MKVPVKNMDEAIEQQRDNRGQWFVIQTLSGHENKVRDTINRQLNLGDQIPVYEALIPESKVKEIRNGKAITVTKKLFPGYVLVRMDLYEDFLDDFGKPAVNKEAWYFVRSIQGVLGYLGNAQRPPALTEQEFLDMNPSLAGDAPAPTLVIGVKIGDIVRIKDGAFMGYEGNVEAIDDTRGRLTVVISIFGRSTPVELEFWQVEPAV
jgi:transcriptional antiterminator NusG